MLCMNEYLPSFEPRNVKRTGQVLMTIPSHVTDDNNVILGQDFKKQHQSICVNFRGDKWIFFCLPFLILTNLSNDCS